MSKLSTDSYKGVRDFYPEDTFVQNYIFKIWREAVESFGYVEYGASILEPAELYKAKTGEEIVNEQTYTFTDRGDREVTLRPEMTPTVARMVAGKIHDLTFPLRWYSIPNLFRYEKPQRGRLREHWQLNVDMFGADSIEADTEIISVAYSIMKKFGTSESDFQIKINSRKLLADLFSYFKMDETETYKVSKIIDKKEKISDETFKTSIEEVLSDRSEDFIRVLSSNERILETLGEKNENSEKLLKLLEKLSASGIKNTVFSPTLMRGFDYYTDVVFEVFDTHPSNNRSVFGGGRYNDLLDIFGTRKVPAVGFGAGDVTARDFLETHNLLPKYRPTTDLSICPLKEEFVGPAETLAGKLRSEGLNVSVDISGKKVGDQLKSADKQGVPFIIVVGQDETISGQYSVKNMETGQETKVRTEEIVKIVKK